MKVVSARSLDEALAALGAATSHSRLLAGGTDLMVELQSGRSLPDLVIDLGAVRELRGIRVTDHGLELGAGTTCSDLLRSADAARHADILVAAAREVGAVQIQNRATLGGNLGTASPAADLTPVLFALGARVRLASRSGSRELPVEQFVVGYRRTARRDDELITGVLLPPRPASEWRAFRKVGTRRAQSISKLVVALAVAHDGGRVTEARVAAGSVADHTLRLTHLEQALLRGLPPAAHAAQRAAAIAACVTADTSPRDDVRSSAHYRRAVLARVLTRLLAECPVP